MKIRTLTLLVAVTLAAACETAAPTHVVVANAYPRHEDSAAIVVHELWWSTTLFDEPLAIREASNTARSVEGSDYAYAVLSGNSVSGLIPLRSKRQLSIDRGGTLHIEVSDDTFDGHCDGGKRLSQRDADFITQRIFPGTFANVRYDAATCTSTKRASDADDIEPDGATGEDAGGAG